MSHPIVTDTQKINEGPKASQLPVELYSHPSRTADWHNSSNGPSNSTVSGQELKLSNVVTSILYGAARLVKSIAAELISFSNDGDGCRREDKTVQASQVGRKSIGMQETRSNRTTNDNETNPGVNVGKYSVHIIEKSPEIDLNSAQAKEIFDSQPVKTLVDLKKIKSASISDFYVPHGITGFKKVIDSQTTLKTSPESLDFIDYFAKKGGVKYIGALEQFETDFDQRLKSESSAEMESVQKEFRQLRKQLKEISTVTSVEQEKELQDFDFCLVIEHDTDKFRIDLAKKIIQLQKTHNFGVKMILRWVYLLQTHEEISPQEVCDFAIELLADIVVSSYAIFTRLGEHFASLVDYSPRVYTSIDFSLACLQNLIHTLLDELGAIGESCGKIIVRIPNLTKHEVIEVMTKLYLQINYANIALSRAVEALTPVILCHALIQYKNNQRKISTNK